MKKLLSVILCVLLLAATVVTVSATASAQMTVSANKTTVYRGDTIDFTVNISSVEDCRSAAFMLNYDSSVFEFVSGSCSLSGTSLANFSSGTGTFAYSSGTTVSGQIFTFRLKVKSDAGFGSHSISANVNTRDSNGAIPTSVNSVGITVVCGHSYGAWTEAGSGHQQTCSACGDVKTGDHDWDDGTPIKQANCKEGGQDKYTCTDCGATKTEDTEKTNDHSYGAWTESGTGHQRTCPVCGDVQTGGHNWDDGMPIKEANCKEGGQDKYTCEDCGATKTQDTPKTDVHKYGSWTKIDDATHKHICSVCQKEETASHGWNGGVVTKKATCKEEGVKTFTCTGCGITRTEKIDILTTHTYDHGCDTDCNVCGKTRTTSHKYSSSWSKDKTNHWHTCTECKDKKDVAKHTPGAEATETTAQTCTVCGYIIKAALGHTHSYGDTWTTDEEGHWYACSGCDERDSYVAHDFENACDGDCSICGYTRETAHVYAEEWASDGVNHWYTCSGCGLKAEEAAHVPGEEATATTAQVCTVCGYELSPALGGEDTQATAPDLTTDGEPAEGGFPWWIVVAVVVVAAGGAAAFVIIKKKKA